MEFWNKYGEAIMQVAALILSLLAAFGAVHYFNNIVGVRDDNLAEEYIEDRIQSQTGIDIDLTPQSPEGSNREDDRS